TDSVERGRLPGASEPGSPSSSQNICPREPSGQPSSGITGEDCNQPPDGVAVNMFPALSMMSICTVSPVTLPLLETACSPAPWPVCSFAKVGSPPPPGPSRAALSITRHADPPLLP